MKGALGFAESDADDYCLREISIVASGLVPSAWTTSGEASKAEARSAAIVRFILSPWVVDRLILKVAHRRFRVSRRCAQALATRILGPAPRQVVSDSSAFRRCLVCRRMLQRVATEARASSNACRRSRGRWRDARRHIEWRGATPPTACRRPQRDARTASLPFDTVSNDFAEFCRASVAPILVIGTLDEIRS